ncbi:MAG: hypothetical protein U0791_23495 [Gemmataceae bacterium]
MGKGRIELPAIRRHRANLFFQRFRACRQFLGSLAKRLLQGLPCVLGLGQCRFPLPQCDSIRFQPGLQIEGLGQVPLQRSGLFRELGGTRVQARFPLAKPGFGRSQRFALEPNLFQPRTQERISLVESLTIQHRIRLHGAEFGAKLLGVADAGAKFSL